MITVTRRKLSIASGLLVACCMLVGLLATLLVLAVRPVWAAPAAAGAIALDPQLATGAFLAAALSTALGAIGAGYAVARVGSAAVGAIAEKPELFGRALVLVGLAEGIAIYGLIVSILILNRLG
jgi:V/A-type H+/Na+-transporting ATPase subunit K